MAAASPRLATRRLWGDRQYFMTIPRLFAENRREVVVIYSRDFLIAVPAEKLGRMTPCELLEVVMARVCLEQAG